MSLSTESLRADAFVAAGDVDAASVDATRIGAPAFVYVQAVIAVRAGPSKPLGARARVAPVSIDAVSVR